MKTKVFLLLSRLCTTTWLTEEQDDYCPGFRMRNLSKATVVLTEALEIWTIQKTTTTGGGFEPDLTIVMTENSSKLYRLRPIFTMKYFPFFRVTR